MENVTSTRYLLMKNVWNITYSFYITVYILNAKVITLKNKPLGETIHCKEIFQNGILHTVNY